MDARPTGTITFLFTDIEGSTKRWERSSGEMQTAYARQHTIIREAIERNHGLPYKVIGDAFQAAFHTAPAALRAALEAQRSLQKEAWGAEGALRVRMALHTGVTEELPDDYRGPLLNRLARILTTGYGGQVLLSTATTILVRESLPEDTTLRDLGEHHLKDLTQPERIFQLVASDLPSVFPPLKSLDMQGTNLPSYNNPFVGREHEIAEIREKLLRQDVRLLTLVGAGGIGKTRLACQVAAELLEEFVHGVFFVPLATLTSPELVMSTIAEKLGLRESGAEPIIETLRTYLREKRMLLVLDNFEQIVDGAPAIGGLIESTRYLKVLITSRARVRLSTEHLYLVPPLQNFNGRPPLPPLHVLTQYAAVALFIQRAQMVDPGFDVDSSNAPAVAEICYRLDGLPLAIELAAARINSLGTPQKLLSRLSSTLELLTGGARDVPERHQTLRGTIDWSHNLLNDAEKAIFRRISVFRGGCSLEAAEEVCTLAGGPRIDVMNAIASLTDSNLIYLYRGRNGEPRYMMLETISEYALEKLEQSGEGARIHRQHAEFFLKLAARGGPTFKGTQQYEAQARIDEEYINLRSVMQWAHYTKRVSPAGAAYMESHENGRDPLEIGLLVAISLLRFWEMRARFREGRERFESLLGLFVMESPDNATIDSNAQAGSLADIRASRRQIFAWATHGRGVLSHYQGDYKLAKQLYNKALVIFEDIGDKDGAAEVFYYLGLAAMEQGRFVAAKAFSERCLALCRELQDKVGMAVALYNLGAIALEQENIAQAWTLIQDGLALFRQREDNWGIAYSLNGLGNVAYLQGDYKAAYKFHEEALEYARTIDDTWDTNYAHISISFVALAERDYERARGLLRETVLFWRETGDEWCTLHALVGLVGLATEQVKERLGDIQSADATGDTRPEVQATIAAQLLGFVTEALRSMEVVATILQRKVMQSATSEIKSILGETNWEKATKEGESLMLEQAISLALQNS